MCWEFFCGFLSVRLWAFEAVFASVSGAQGERLLPFLSFPHKRLFLVSIVGRERKWLGLLAKA